MWETIEKAGMITANIMWYVQLLLSIILPGSEPLVYTQARSPGNSYWRQTHLLCFVRGDDFYIFVLDGISQPLGTRYPQ